MGIIWSMIWGKPCIKCGKAATNGDYCEGCYERKFPSCARCDKPICDGDEKVGSCHKKPCYSDRTRRCCECDDRATKGSYCESCYDSKFPPPVRAEALGGGMNFKLRSRKELDQKTLNSAMYSLGQGMKPALTGGQQKCYERRFPVCKHCKKPIRDGEAKFGGCHKNPCYNNMTRRCCECNGTASDGSYCKSCYDKKFPPPLRAVASGGGMKFKLYSREEPNQRMIDFAKYSLGQGMNRPLTGRQQRLCLPPPSETSPKTPRHWYDR